MQRFRAALRVAWHKRYEFFRFMLANAFCNGVFLSIFIGSVELFGWHYLVGSLLGFVGYTVSQFILMSSFVYRSRELHARKALVRYVKLLAFNQIVNMTLLGGLVEGVKIPSVSLFGFGIAGYILAQLMANVVSFIINRYGSSKIFRTQ